jgi:tetratricopeptide (TPR) repeat protein
MNASASPRCCLALVILWGAVSMLRAQDFIVQKDGQRREGEILGVVDGKLKIKVGPAETGIAMDQIASVTMAAPKEYEDAIKVWQEGNANRTLSLLKPVVVAFRGLPTEWAERAAALLGDVYLSLGQLPAAESAFAEFTTSYPNATSLSDIGLARLAVSKKDFAAAKAKLLPIVSEADKVVAAPAGKSAVYGQAFYLIGMVHESEGAYSDALRDYLTTVTLFHDDRAAVAKAQERADVLVKEKQVIVP